MAEVFAICDFCPFLFAICGFSDPYNPPRPTYNVLRQKLFHDIAENNNEFNELNEFEKFCFLLTAQDAGDLISKYLNKTLQIRKYLIEKPKQNG